MPSKPEKSMEQSEKESISSTDSVNTSPTRTLKKKKIINFFRHKKEKNKDTLIEKESETYLVVSSTATFQASYTEEDRDRPIVDAAENRVTTSSGEQHSPVSQAETNILTKQASPRNKAPSPLPDTHELQVKLRSGEDLAPRDSNGKSDPYVKFRVGDRTVFKSRCCKETLNPIWDEEFDVLLNLQSSVSLRVFDKDLALRDDFMGEGKIDLSTLEDTFMDVTVHLEDHSTDEELGFIHLEMRLVSISKREKVDTLIQRIPLPTFATPSKSEEIPKAVTNPRREVARHTRKASVNSRNLPPVAMATVQLVSGCDLPARDTNGFSDPYVKLCLGKAKKKKSKICTKTLNPVWREEFTFYLTTQETSTLEVTVWDRDTYKKDDFMGRCELDLWSLTREETHSLSLKLVDTQGSLLFLVTVHEIEPDEKILTSYDLSELRVKYSLASTFKDMKNIGFAEVRVISASDLKSADITGKSDPFCVVQLCNARAQTHTCYKTLEPVWNRAFNFPIHDVNDIFTITVFDQDQNNGKEFLGRIGLPILRATNGSERTYALKDRNLKERSKGTITLQINFIFNPIRAAVRTIQPREENFMEEAIKFKKDLLLQNFSRVWRIVQCIITTAEFFNSCFTWQNRARSAVAFLMFLLIVWNFEMYMLPVALLMLLCKNFIDIFVRKSRPSRHMMDADEVQRASGEDDDEEEEASNSKSTGLLQKLRAIEEVLTKVQNILDTVASFGERVYNTVTWSVPFLGWLLVLLLVAACVILYFIPLRILIIAWGINKFTKRLRKPNYVPNNELMDYLSRIPSNIQLDQYRELSSTPPLRNNSKKKR